MTEPLHFFLNDREMQVSVSPDKLVLDFLRERQRLTGTKEGCREGDCGACAVLIGELIGGRVDYRPVTSCLMPMGQVQGKHLVTIEGLNRDDLTVVQQAIVDEGATQCGFCTPGIVVSLTGYLMETGGPPTPEGVKNALGGHLCRCTGYRSLKAVADHLAASHPKQRGLDRLISLGSIPSYFADIPDRLAALRPSLPADGLAPADVLIAGGTDVYVQTEGEFGSHSVGVLDGVPELSGIVETDEAVDVGALTTFEEFAQNPVIVRLIPEIADYMALIASLQIRNRATVGGNIVNASPIGDLTILLLALDAVLVLRDGRNTREVSLSEFYFGYKEMDRRPGEVLGRIRIPRPPVGTRIHWEKVSKRKFLDISSVNSAVRLRLEGERIMEARIAMGGVAPVPLLLRETGEWLRGRSVSAQTVLEAANRVQSEITPISDVRGSAVYKRLLSRQLLIAHFEHLCPDSLRVEEVYATS